MLIANVKIFQPNVAREKYSTVTSLLNEALSFMVACAMTFHPMYDSIVQFYYQKLSLSGCVELDKPFELVQATTIGRGQRHRRKASDDVNLSGLTDNVSKELHLAIHHSHR